MIKHKMINSNQTVALFKRNLKNPVPKVRPPYGRPVTQIKGLAAEHGHIPQFPTPLAIENGSQNFMGWDHSRRSPPLNCSHQLPFGRPATPIEGWWPPGMASPQNFETIYGWVFTLFIFYFNFCIYFW